MPDTMEITNETLSFVLPEGTTVDSSYAGYLEEGVDYSYQGIERHSTEESRRALEEARTGRIIRYGDLDELRKHIEDI